MYKHVALVVLIFFGFCRFVCADTPAPEASDADAHLKKIADSLHYQQGEINLRSGLAKLSVPSNFRYLDRNDTQTVLTKLWGNPPSSSSNLLGMLVPAEISPADQNSWAIVISYDEDGYVKDTDAAKLDYSDVLKKMQEAVHESNTERTKQGYSTIELVGWATPPKYDAASHKMYWAKELAFGDSAEHTLNYNIRMLGRRGVLVLNAVSAMDRLQEIEGATPAILGMVDFQEGHRYVDFNPSTDKVATYGLAALVAGGVLAKAGFFKVLIAGILALKKFVIIAVVAVGTAVKKLFAKITGKRDLPSA